MTIPREEILARQHAMELLASCKELRDSLAAAMRVIYEATIDKADIVDCFVDEMQRTGITNGVGVRADAVIAKAEGL